MTRLLKYWKYLLPLLAAIAAYFAYQHQITKVHDAAFIEGKEAAAVEVQKAFELVMLARNERIKQLEAQVKDYDLRLAAADKARLAKETVIKDRIEDKLKEVPDCKIDQSLIQDLNKLRALK